jgi:urease accessory protein
VTVSPTRVSRKGKSSTDALTESVGRVGELRLEYAKRDGRTIIARSHCTSPWHLLPPIYLDETGAAYTLLVNPSGGLVGGDHLSIGMRLGADAHVLISAPSANRVYRSRGDASIQDIQLTLGPGAVLEWLPEHTIPFAGSRFRQTIHAQLEPGATILLWDAVASGRIARDERWAFASLENEIRITTAGGQSILERYGLDPATDLGAVGLAAQWDYVASLYVVNDAVASEVWNRLEERIGVLLDERAERILGGVSQPAAPGVAVKLLARTAPDVTGALDVLWAAVRAELWNLPPVAWRKY